ncbi:MAG: hypothetical protein ACRDRO_28015 [Pseudonocardiaceae bacterium]
MSLTLLVAVFGIVLVAELPTRPRRRVWCWAPATGQVSCSSGWRHLGA